MHFDIFQQFSGAFSKVMKHFPKFTSTVFQLLRHIRNKIFCKKPSPPIGHRGMFVFKKVSHAQELLTFVSTSVAQDCRKETCKLFLYGSFTKLNTRKFQFTGLMTVCEFSQEKMYL